MAGVAGAEQHNIHPRLVPHIAVGGVRHAAGAVGVDQKTERVVRSGQPRRNLTGCRELPHRRGQLRRSRKDTAHGEHHQRADAVGDGVGKHLCPRHLVHQVERYHRGIPATILHRPVEHELLGIVRRRLGDAEEAKFALVALLAAGQAR